VYDAELSEAYQAGRRASEASAGGTSAYVTDQPSSMYQHFETKASKRPKDDFTIDHQTSVKVPLDSHQTHIDVVIGHHRCGLMRKFVDIEQLRRHSRRDSKR
jgi:hypothetical protein